MLFTHTDIRQKGQMKTLLSAAYVLTFAIPVFAGHMIIESNEGRKAAIEPCPPVSRILFDIDSSYVFKSNFKGERQASGDAYSGSATFGYRIPLGEGWPNEQCGSWNLRIGAHYARHDFDNEGGLPIPNHIQAAAGVLALEYIVNNETAILLETHPGVYFEDEIDGRNFDAPTTLGAAYRFSDTFIGVFGVTYGAFRTYPILPGIGFKWVISDKLTLTAVFPKATLDYKLSTSCGFFVGGEYVGDAVRVDKTAGRPANLDHAVLQYSEYRAGAGFRFNTGVLSGEIGGGYAFERDFNFHRADRTFRTHEGAPYIKAELHAAF
jgi:hypothetical protein